MLNKNETKNKISEYMTTTNHPVYYENIKEISGLDSNKKLSNILDSLISTGEIKELGDSMYNITKKDLE